MSSFTEVYKTALSPFIQKYADAKNEKVRKVVISDAVAAIHETRENQEDKADLAKDLPKAIKKFLKSAMKKDIGEAEGDEPKPRKLKLIYTIRDVIKQNHRGLVEEKIPCTPKDKEYLSHYQKAVTTVLEEMSDAEKTKAENIAEKWSKEGAPRDVQLKRAKKLPKEIKKQVTEWKFKTGAQILCLVAYPDGKEVTAFHVESDPVSGNKFSDSCSDWRGGTFEIFKDWSIKQFGIKEMDSDDEEDIPVDMMKAKEIKFEKNEEDILILPEMKDYNTVKKRQRVIRAYIGATYRQFTGTSNSAFPYLLAAKDNQQIYSQDCVPEGFVLSDPDHVKSEKINLLYLHLIRRQNQGLVPFVILNCSPLHVKAVKKSEKAKGKRKAEYMDVSTDEEGLRDDLEEGFIPIRVGPPGKKSGASNVAGPSNISRVENPSEEKTTKSRSKDPSQKKNKKQKVVNVDDKPQEPTEPSRTTKPSRPKAKASKPAIETIEKLGKRKRTVNVKDEPMDPPIPTKRLKTSSPTKKKNPAPRAQPRSTTRFKENPAGNSATSGSRTSFLKRLCDLPNFQALVDLIPSKPKSSPIPPNYPVWASWNSQNIYLPAEFHNSASFKKNVSILQTSFADPINGDKVDAPLLLFGLIFREISRSMEVDFDGKKVHDRLKSSRYGERELNQITKILANVTVPPS